MRRWIPALAAAAALAAAPAALAAPTCLDVNGGVIRCGTPGAMPVGWNPPPEQLAARLASAPEGPTLGEILRLIWVIGGLFTLIAVLPPFDGWEAGDWDRQEADDEG